MSAPSLRALRRRRRVARRADRPGAALRDLGLVDIQAPPPFLDREGRVLMPAMRAFARRLVGVEALRGLVGLGDRDEGRRAKGWLRAALCRRRVQLLDEEAPVALVADEADFLALHLADRLALRDHDDVGVVRILGMFHRRDEMQLRSDMD